MTFNFKKFINFITCKKPQLPNYREIFINEKFPLNEEVIIPFQYTSNEILSSKYTIWNFIFLNLFEQFQRIANFYFILVMIIQLLIDSPVSPLTTVVPIVFVLSVTAIKQAIEDFMRHKADNEVNGRLIDVLREHDFQATASSMIKVGDIVKVNSGSAFPCDLILLSSSDESGECTVTTANLDGETSLKIQLCVNEVRVIDFTKSNHSVVKITCGQPVEDLYAFSGTIDIFNDRIPISFPLSSKNLLLRGAVLKNTEYITGVAVFTGADTKLSMNSKGKVPKYSRVELQLNYYLIAYFAVLLSVSIICMICLYVYRQIHIEMYGSWYVDSNTLTGWIATQEFFGFIVIYNYLIPISLYVTIEIIKFVGGFFIRVDLEMYDSFGDTRARVNTSDLNEELGQINYLFSDKTGTLTENDMQFRRCSINGIQYIDVEGQLCKMSLKVNGWDEILTWPYNQFVTDFLIFLCVCHTVRVDRNHSGGSKVTENGYIGPLGDKAVLSLDGMDYDYQASSPDEKAFVEASRRYCVVYHGCIEGLHKVTLKGQVKHFKIREVFEFDSDRKCMSAIVDYPDGTIKLLCKGAESSMLPKASKNSKSVSSDIIMKHLTEYAENGLRTLVFGYKDISKSDAEMITLKLNECKKSLHDVESLLAKLYKEVESDLILIGCTGIEDRLQDGVKETLEDIRAAGIKVWVLTGDKEETAVNISYSAGHFASNMHEMRLTKCNTLTEARRALETQLERMETASIIEPKAAYCLIVDGKSLQLMLEPALESDFVQLCMQVSTVLCCRMTPLQKAEIVKMIKINVKPEPVTCAIGDGGNDVSMIQEAHVGLGIFGKEGRQAVRAADYAIAKFYFSRRLILLHGHYFYSRISILIQYFFYKNMVFIAPQFYFAFFNLFSATPMYYAIILALYNVTFTTLPIMIYGLFEQVLSENELLSKSYLYKRNENNKLLKINQFISWNLNGLWHSLVIFFGHYLFASFNNSISGENGKENPLTFFGQTIFFSVWIVVTVKLYLITTHFNYAVLITFFIISFGNIILFVIMSFVPKTSLFYYVIVELFSQPSFWLSVFIISFIALIPDIIFKIYYSDQYRRIIQLPAVKRIKPHRRRSYIPSRQRSRKDNDEKDDGGFGSFNKREFKPIPENARYS